MARVHKSRSMSLASAKALAKAFNETRFLISGDRYDKRAWNRSRTDIRAALPACYHAVFDEGCPAFGAGLPAAKYPQRPEVERTERLPAPPVQAASRVAPPEAIEAPEDAHDRRAGELAYACRLRKDDCPYPAGTRGRATWLHGYGNAEYAASLT